LIIWKCNNKISYDDGVKTQTTKNHRSLPTQQDLDDLRGQAKSNPHRAVALGVVTNLRLSDYSGRYQKKWNSGSYF